MNIIACVKVVPEEQDIVVNADHTLNMEKAASKISLYDLNALEEATKLAKEGDKVIALSVGGQRLGNSKVHKDILSRGADELLLVSDPALDGAMPAATAKVLAAAAQKTGFDLLICGEGSSDLYAQITGILAAEELHLPVINAVTKLALADGKIVAERTLENETEEVSLALPAVVCVTSAINEPRIPNMKAILQAGKKPVSTVTPADLGVDCGPCGTQMQSVLAPTQKERMKNIIEGDSDENIAAFADNLRKALN